MKHGKMRMTMRENVLMIAGGGDCPPVDFKECRKARTERGERV